MTEKFNHNVQPTDKAFYLKQHRKPTIKKFLFTKNKTNLATV